MAEKKRRTAMDATAARVVAEKGGNISRVRKGVQIGRECGNVRDTTVGVLVVSSRLHIVRLAVYCAVRVAIAVGI